MKDDLFALIDDDLFRAYSGKIDLPQLKRSCKLLEDLRDQIGGPFIPKLLEEKAEEKARHILSDFRSAILTAKQRRKKDYLFLLDHPVVQSLFPFIRFNRRAEVRILLVTLQKAFYGFFDGSETLSLSKLTGYVVFLDEFDFLENELIGLISRSPQIDDPFLFVEFFYGKIAINWDWGVSCIGWRHSSATHRDPKRIELLHNAGIKYPEVNQFICRSPEANAAVFRTAHRRHRLCIYVRRTGHSSCFQPRCDL